MLATFPVHYEKQRDKNTFLSRCFCIIFVLKLLLDIVLVPFLRCPEEHPTDKCLPGSRVLGSVQQPEGPERNDIGIACLDIIFDNVAFLGILYLFVAFLSSSDLECPPSYLEV